jgi:hypothetical protein
MIPSKHLRDGLLGSLADFFKNLKTAPANRYNVFELDMLASIALSSRNRVI